MSTPNFTITDKKTGKVFWISRSIVVTPLVFKCVRNEMYALIEKRGKAVSHSGRWCCPCGYLDWDETLEQACIREVKEETGVDLNPTNILFMGYNSNPDDLDRQNVSMRFACFVNEHTELDISKITTKNEVDELKWIHVGHYGFSPHEPVTPRGALVTYGPDYFKFDESLVSGGGLKWAFHHNQLIIEVISKYIKEKENLNVVIP